MRSDDCACFQLVFENDLASSDLNASPLNSMAAGIPFDNSFLFQF